jgi:hypothetical protein
MPRPVITSPASVTVTVRAAADICLSPSPAASGKPITCRRSGMAPVRWRGRLAAQRTTPARGCRCCQRLPAALHAHLRLFWSTWRHASAVWLHRPRHCCCWTRFETSRRCSVALPGRAGMQQRIATSAPLAPLARRRLNWNQIFDNQPRWYSLCCVVRAAPTAPSQRPTVQHADSTKRASTCTREDALHQQMPGNDWTTLDASTVGSPQDPSWWHCSASAGAGCMQHCMWTLCGTILDPTAACILADRWACLSRNLCLQIADFLGHAFVAAVQRRLRMISSSSRPRQAELPAPQSATAARRTVPHGWPLQRQCARSQAPAAALAEGAAMAASGSCQTVRLRRRWVCCLRRPLQWLR